jgi:NhaP-type Na+/H+ or K+/H+ antiporter
MGIMILEEIIKLAVACIGFVSSCLGLVGAGLALLAIVVKLLSESSQNNSAQAALKKCPA